MTHLTNFEQLPAEIMFSVLKAAQNGGPRLGALRLQGRKPIDTPHYLGCSSRGAIPHLSQDNYVKRTDIRGIYAAVEDFIERYPQQVPPVYKFTQPDGSSPLRRFIGLPEDHLLVLGARRTPPVPLPTPNAQAPNSAIQVLTSVGFRHVIAKDYVEATSILQPDIIVGPGDIPVDTKQISRKKKVKITDRTTRWMQEQVQYRRDKEGNGLGQPALFAPLLPLEVEAQSDYIGHIVDEMTDQVQGLAVYDTCSLKGLPSALETLPKMSFTDPASPHTLLREIAQGLDIFTVPFIGAVTDAGIALDFSFPVKAGQTESQELKPLGVDMWPSTFAADLSPLREGCPCYACTNHHKAYLQHLLSAKEMLGWVLLQIHNHCVMDEFFAGVRDSISQGSFEEDTEAFARMYEAELPEKTGQGPRVRGYQFKAEGPDEPKKNPTAYRKLDDAKEKLAEAVLPSPNADAGDLEALGFAEQTSNTDGR